LLDEIGRGAMAMEDGVELLLPAARPAADFLLAAGDKVAVRLLRALLRRTPDNRFIAVGNDFLTNAGQFRVTGLRHAQTQAHLEVCPNDGGPYLLVGKLWPDALSLPVQIDLGQQTIQFLKSPVYRCQFTGQPPCDYVYADPKELKRHYRQTHRMDWSEINKVNFLNLDLTRLILLPPNGVI
jgi:hypothetical protein